MNRETLKLILIFAGFTAVILFLLSVFWPLIIIALAAGGIWYWVNKRKTQKAAENLQNDLFYSQIRRKREENIIDAEYIEKEKKD